MKGKRKAAALIVRSRVWLMIILLVTAGWSVTMISRTRINYDLTRYLSEDTMTRQALKVMEEEFGSGEQLRLMFSDQPEDSLRNILDTLNAREEIQIASHDPDTDVKQAGGKTWQLVTVTLRECDASALTEELRGLFPEAGEYAVGGSAAEMLDIQRSVAKEIPEVMMISVAVVLLVLLLTSHAWLEPVAILITLAVSILINMGTNFIFRDVSFITYAVSAILQLALSIDYAIMLLHTFNACSDEGMEPKEAMTEALAQCFMRISSSAMTTVAGLLSLLFMSFTIGFDIGMVLSKGIVISMLGVFLFMPALTLLMEKPLKATRHKPVPVGGKHLAAGINRVKKPAAAVLILLVVAGAVLTGMNTYTFTAQGTMEDSESGRINRVFGSSNPIVILFPGGEEDADYDLQRDLVSRLQELKRENGESTVRDITAMVTDGAEALKYYTPQDVAEMTGMPEIAIRMFFMTQGFGESVRADRLLASAGDFAADNETVADLQKQLAAAKAAFEGKQYSRIVLEPAFRNGDADLNACMDSILSAAKAVYGDDCYVTGSAMSGYDIGNAFRSDLLKVNIITFLAILLIVTVSFRSFRLPLLLVFVIEGAIWITMGISRIMGQPIFFMCYLICLSIQMGATIDYGIMVSDQYRSLRRSGQKAGEAMAEALHRALPTILTSGTILITAGYVIGKRCSVYYIASIGALLARGALISVILVLTLLPALLLIFDRFVIKEEKKDEL